MDGQYVFDLLPFLREGGVLWAFVTASEPQQWIEMNNNILLGAGHGGLTDTCVVEQFGVAGGWLAFNGEQAAVQGSFAPIAGPTVVHNSFQLQSKGIASVDPGRPLPLLVGVQGSERPEAGPSLRSYKLNSTAPFDVTFLGHRGDIACVHGLEAFTGGHYVQTRQGYLAQEVHTALSATDASMFIFDAVASLSLDASILHGGARVWSTEPGSNGLDRPLVVLLPPGETVIELDEFRSDWNATLYAIQVTYPELFHDTFASSPAVTPFPVTSEGRDPPGLRVRS